MITVPVFNIYDILSTQRDSSTGSVTAQLGDAINGSVYSNNAEMWFPPGLISIPPNVPSNPTDAPQAISISRNDNDIIIAQRYVPGQSIAGTQLNPGDTCIYANGETNQGQARLILNGTNLISLMTRANANAQIMILGFDPSTDTIQLTNAAGFGIVINTDGVTIISKDSTLDLTGGNARLISKQQTQVDGQGVVLGSVAVPGVNSALIGPAGLSGVASSKVLIQS